MKTVAITEREWEDLRKVRLASLLDSPDAFGISYDEVIDYTSDKWKALASGKIGPSFFISYKNKKPVGLIGGVLSDGNFELVSMWVSPVHRGGKVAAVLVNTLKTYVLSCGHKAILLQVSPKNKPACGLYKKCGFNVTGSSGTLASGDLVSLQRMEWSASV